MAAPDNLLTAPLVEAYALFQTIWFRGSTQAIIKVEFSWVGL